MSGHMKLTGYSVDGFALEIVLPITTAEDVAKNLKALKEQGITAQPQDPDAAKQERETIASVIRREHSKNGVTVPLIDLYPAWKGEYGQYRFTSIYLDAPADVQAFEQHSGLKVAALPLYEAQQPLKRTPGNTHRCEVKCATPFVAIKGEAGEKEVQGIKQMTYKFVGYESVALPTSTVPAASPEVREEEIPF